MKENNFFFLFMLLTVVTISAILIYLQSPKTAVAGQTGYRQMMY